MALWGARAVPYVVHTSNSLSYNELAQSKPAPQTTECPLPRTKIDTLSTLRMSCRLPSVSSRLFEERQDFTRLGVAPRPRFLVHGFPVAKYFEAAASRRNHLQVRLGKTLANLSRQTGGSRLVVSNDAIFDADLHSARGFGLLGGRRELLYKLSRLGGIDLFESIERRPPNDALPDVLRHQLLGEWQRGVFLQADVGRKRGAADDERSIRARNFAQANGDLARTASTQRQPAQRGDSFLAHSRIGIARRVDEGRLY